MRTESINLSGIRAGKLTDFITEMEKYIGYDVSVFLKNDKKEWKGVYRGKKDKYVYSTYFWLLLDEPVERRYEGMTRYKLIDMQDVAHLDFFEKNEKDNYVMSIINKVAGLNLTEITFEWKKVASGDEHLYLHGLSLGEYKINFFQPVVVDIEKIKNEKLISHKGFYPLR